MCVSAWLKNCHHFHKHDLAIRVYRKKVCNKASPDPSVQVFEFSLSKRTLTSLPCSSPPQSHWQIYQSRPASFGSCDRAGSLPPMLPLLLLALQLQPSHHSRQALSAKHHHAAHPAHSSASHSFHLCPLLHRH